MCKLEANAKYGKCALSTTSRPMTPRLSARVLDVFRLRALADLARGFEDAPLRRADSASPADSDNLHVLRRARLKASGIAASLVIAGLLVGCGAQGPGVDLQITGGMSADVVGDQGSCSPAPAAGPAGMIASFAVVPNGLYYNLRFLTNRVGAGEYDVSTAGTFVAFNGQGPGWSTLNDHSGTLVVNSDGRSGTIDVTLSPVPGSSTSPIRISGTWRCPA